MPIWFIFPTSLLSVKYINILVLCSFMVVEFKSLLTKMDSMKKELDCIKENMVQRDEIMTLNEFEAYKESLDKDNLISFADAKKQLGF